MRQLSASDYNTNADEWLEAPICVASNMERFHFTWSIAQRYAQHNNVPIITWNMNILQTTFTKSLQSPYE